MLTYTFRLSRAAVFNLINVRSKILENAKRRQRARTARPPDDRGSFFLLRRDIINYKQGCDSSPNCGFCLEPIGNTFMKLNCGHAYHEKCIKDAVELQPNEYSLNNFKCPQCRKLTYVHRDVHDCNELKGNIDNRHVNDILLAAAEIGLKELVTSSLAKKADLSCTDHRGSTPLHRAAYNGRTDVVCINSAFCQLKKNHHHCLSVGTSVYFGYLGPQGGFPIVDSRSGYRYLSSTFGPWGRGQ